MKKKDFSNLLVIIAVSYILSIEKKFSPISNNINNLLIYILFFFEKRHEDEDTYYILRNYLIKLVEVQSFYLTKTWSSNSLINNILYKYIAVNSNYNNMRYTDIFI